MNKKLKPEVAAKYKLAEDYPIHGYEPKFGEIDLSEIGLDSADQLHAAGFKGLELIPKKPDKKPG
jgi:hypothetical protein